MNTNSHFEPRRFLKITLSKHAQKRGQQRGLTTFDIQVIREFATRTHDGRGGVRYLFDSKAQKRCLRQTRGMFKSDYLRGAYVVDAANDLGASQITVTVGHRR